MTPSNRARLQLRHVGLAVAAVILANCGRELSLPAAPQAVQPPAITGFAPHAAFANELIAVTGTGFDPKAENNVVRLVDGTTAPAIARPDADSTHLWFALPPAVRDNGPIIVATRGLASAPSTDDVVVIGHGHPVAGNAVTDLRFRHRPVGVVDTTETLLAASTLFNAVVDDGGKFKWMDGRPQVFVRMYQGGGALLATRSEAGGRLIEVDVDTGDALQQSAPSPVFEQFVLAMPAAASTLARTIGTDANGQTWLSTWKRSGGALEATRVKVAFSSVLGAAQHGDDVVLVGTLESLGASNPSLVRVDAAGAVTLLWQPTEDYVPSGPVALVETPHGVMAVIAVAGGDLIIVPINAPESWRRRSMISFAPIFAVAPTEAPGKVLVTKPRDGALFQLDVEADEFDWIVQLRGEPTVIDVSPELDEIAVANGEDNNIDVVSSVDGHWLGRSSISLEIGSADAGEGGIVSAYSYDPADYVTNPADYGGAEVLRLLCRAAPLVLDIDAGSLSILRERRLAEGASPPLRLAMTAHLDTMVVHSRELGVLEEAGERLVARNLRAPPLLVAFLRDNRVLVGMTTGVDLFEWNNGLLERKGEIPMPAHATLMGLISHRARRTGSGDHGDGGRDVVLIAWRSPAGMGGGFYDPATLSAGSQPTIPITLPTTAKDPTGIVDLADGPAMLFGQGVRVAAVPVGPVLLNAAALRGDPGAVALPGLADSPFVSRSTADRRFVIWSNESAGEHVVRVLKYSPKDGLQQWAGYRLEASAAVPGNDPSGEWLYIPLPKLDMISVVQ